MSYVMMQYDRPTDTRNWTEYNRQVKDWIAQLLAIQGITSLVAYRTSDGTSPNTLVFLEFRTRDEAKTAVGSAQLGGFLQALKALRAPAKVHLLERSPFTPEPIRP